MKIDLDNLEVTLSKNSFHYKFMKFILGSIMPNLNTLCPYFWLFWFCVLISPVWGTLKLLSIGFYKGCVNTGEFIDNKFLKPRFENWVANLSDLQIYSLRNHYSDNRPLVFDSGYYYESRHEILNKFMAVQKITWAELEERSKKGEKIFWDNYKKEQEAREARSKRFKNLGNRITNRTNNLINKIPVPKGTYPKQSTKPKEDFKLPIALIVKWTKRVLGTLFTLLIGYGLYKLGLIVYTYSLTITKEMVMNTLQWVGIVILIILAVAILVTALIIGINYLQETRQKNRYQSRDNWFTRSIEWIADGIIRVCTWIAAPFIFCYQYFVATKDDYCPGIVWEDEKD